MRQLRVAVELVVMGLPRVTPDQAHSPAVAGLVIAVIPTLNEEASIGAVVRSIPRDVVSRVIVADGGSRDGTAACERGAGAIVIDVGPGYGRACLLATQAAVDAD